MNSDLEHEQRLDHESRGDASQAMVFGADMQPHDNLAAVSSDIIIPAFQQSVQLSPDQLRSLFTQACQSWLTRSPSAQTRDDYARDLRQFMAFAGLPLDAPEKLATVRPVQVAAWRDHLRERGLTNSSIRRKLTVLRSLFSYLKTYGYTGANPAHGDFVAAPSVPRDGKTVGLTPQECRRLLDAPDPSNPAGIRDRAILAVLACSACRVGELARLRVNDYLESAGHKVLNIYGKGGKERRVPLAPEAWERLDEWLARTTITDDSSGPMFRATVSARGKGNDGFATTGLTRRAIQRIVKRYGRETGLDSRVTVHSFRVTAITTARERGADLVDLQDYAGHSDPRVTLAYIRNRDRMSKSPAYILNY